ncbi:LOW QUALITY PROTEIN: nuclear intron maturase 4, mitochondrial-like [Dioscorea cayenensis subsp. rotundata]|uniref:LOW QUALITY PROTEIN: nuclear intron maturase 4, mitochondrial-like n=1 Tax=Dioscorea cayennensis subsp. rotundata TaxID=55577 RepID=A0AB40CR04_DIOCR|nr:LOW QUALITY PROTEIN: nuclear intron maturase 4, mitochondrial-like [Dioscorea cayenensis subsp. rotundata]
MWSGAVSTCRRVGVLHLLRRVNFSPGLQLCDRGWFPAVFRAYTKFSIIEEVDDDRDHGSWTYEKSALPMTLAKSLACLPDESSTSIKKKKMSRMELKRAIELRIKKRVKVQYSHGKFHDLMEKVIANASTLQDAYDIVRLNSNVDIGSEREDLSFASMAEQLASGKFDVNANSYACVSKNEKKECLVLPRLKLKVIEEAIRVVLEIVYRPFFSKISHGCRSGRGHLSALRYVCKEINKPDWCFTICMNKEADDSVISKLISTMEERIIDNNLFSFIRCLFHARVLNLTFGCIPKGHGLLQEGVLSPILMNIYLDMLDREFFAICMRHEGLGLHAGVSKGGQHSMLRSWIRRQRDSADSGKELINGSDVRIYACRYMDEIFVAVSGSKDVALSVKTDITNYLRLSLNLDVIDYTDILPMRDRSCVQFLGTMVRVTAEESEAEKAVHKLKDKVRLFASQKKEIWDAGTVRVGQKWLAYGLKRIKESEIKQLKLSTQLLDHVAQFRKDGMKTDHWFKSLLKIWLQDINARAEANEGMVLSKYITEPALPSELRESFYDFQMQAEKYISSETTATLALLCKSSNIASTSMKKDNTVTKMEAPISFIAKILNRYGLINLEGFPRHVSTLILQDDDLIIAWFSGLVCRWLKWYSEYDNFGDIKIMISECVRISCIRTLAAKYRIHESLIEKQFDSELSSIPMTEELETEMASITSSAENQDEGLMYGISYSGLCVLSLYRVKVPSRVFNCFVFGCCVSCPSMYTLLVKERQKFPGWKTGFSAAIHPSLNGRRIGLCNQHVKDLYMGHISLQSIEFGALNK